MAVTLEIDAVIDPATAGASRFIGAWQRRGKRTVGGHKPNVRINFVTSLACGACFLISADVAFFSF